MMATETSIKKDGLCSLTAQKLSEEQGFTATGGPPGMYIYIVESPLQFKIPKLVYKIIRGRPVNNM